MLKITQNCYIIYNINFERSGNMADIQKRQEESERTKERMERIRQYNEDVLLHRFSNRPWRCPPHCPPNCPMLSADLCPDSD